MGRYDGYLIVSDIDGTLTQGGDVISAENLDALHRFMDGGGYFTLGTGRTPKFLPAFPIRPNAPLIAVNGTWVVSEAGETLQMLPVTDDPADVLRYFLDSHPGIVDVYFYNRCGDKRFLKEEIFSDLSPLLDNPEPCLKYYFTCESEEFALPLLRDAIARYGDRYEYNRSWPNGVEMHQKGSGKDAGLRFLRSFLPGIRTTIAVGNYENDVSMIREADIGCAVEDAAPSVLAAADRIVAPCAGHALSYIIDTLIPSLTKQP